MGAEEQITQDGKEGNAYGRLEWSSDSKTLTTWQTVPGDEKLVSSGDSEEYSERDPGEENREFFQGAVTR